MAGEQLELGDDDRSITLKRAWSRALVTLASLINKAAFEGYIRPIQPIGYSDGTATLRVASAWAREWLKKYAPDIKSALEEHLGSPLEIRFTLITTDDRPVFGGAPAKQEAAPEPAVAASTRAPAVPPLGAIPSVPLNEE